MKPTNPVNTNVAPNKANSADPKKQSEAALFGAADLRLYKIFT